MRVHGSGDGGWKEKKEHEGGKDQGRKGVEMEAGKSMREEREKRRREERIKGGRERELRVHGSGDGGWKEHEVGKGEETEGGEDKGRKGERVEGAWEWRVKGKKGREIRVQGVEMEAEKRRKSMMEEREKEGGRERELTVHGSGG